MDLNADKLKKAIQDAINDLTTLEVATLTDLSTEPLALDTVNSNGDVFTKIKANLSKANLVAYTKYELDGDSINFITQRTELTELVKEHGTLVESSLNTRKALFDSILSAAKSLFK